ncbi:MAG: hypothetical protein V1867_04100 [Candidatus Falkowbacteria bacterium]
MDPAKTQRTFFKDLKEGDWFIIFDHLQPLYAGYHILIKTRNLKGENGGIYNAVFLNIGEITTVPEAKQVLRLRSK